MYFTPVGWVDTTMAPRIARIDMRPAAGHAGAFRSASVVLTLAGIAAKCQPGAAADDPHRCPP